MKFETDIPASPVQRVPKTGVASIHDPRPDGRPIPIIRGNEQTPRGTIRSGRTRLEVPKIGVLVAMLLLVIYAMHEAGKPKNWEWMGFKNQANPTVLDSNQADLDQADSLPNQSDAAVPTALEDSKFRLSPTAPSPSKALDPAAPSAKASQDDSIDVEADLNTIKSAIRVGTKDQIAAGPSSKIASEFWQSTIGKMKPEQQSAFLKMLRSSRRGEPLDPEIKGSCASLLKTISRNRDRFHQRLFDQLALTNEGTEEKKKLSSDLFASQATWDEKILPAFNATIKGEDFTVDQLRAIEGLQSIIDPVLYDQVQDSTAIGWAGDAGAWKRIWEIVLGNSGSMLTPNETATDFKPVTRIELMSQPRFYRGEPIKVEGWVRSAKKIELGNSALGIKHQYVMWVRPKETKQGPYCIYAHNLPKDFPELSTQYQDINEHVKVDGYFFKIRTYVAADSSAITSPVIVAAGLTRIPPVEYTSVHSWQPSRATFILALLLMPILATAIAWWAYRGSQTKSYQPGKKTTTKINQTLGKLTSDPNVQTDQEKVMALYDSDLYDSEAGDADEYQDEFENEFENENDLRTDDRAGWDHE